MPTPTLGQEIGNRFGRPVVPEENTMVKTSLGVPNDFWSLPVQICISGRLGSSIRLRSIVSGPESTFPPSAAVWNKALNCMGRIATTFTEVYPDVRREIIAEDRFVEPGEQPARNR